MHIIDYLILKIFNFFLRIAIFSIVSVPIYTRTNSALEVPFIHILTTSRLFDRYSNRCEGISHGGFDLHFPDD